MIEDVLLALGLLALVFLPALCFVAIFRVIDYVADDELVARVRNGNLQTRGPTGRQSPNSTERSQPTRTERSQPTRTERSDLSGATQSQPSAAEGSPVPTADQSNQGSEGDRPQIQCRTCGTNNWQGATFCQNCLQRVS